MSRSNGPTAVQAYYGMAHTFWDISFTKDQLRYAAVDDQDRRSISVHIDEQTGEVTLNDGYAPGCKPFEEENELFANFKDAIVEALVAEVPNEEPGYAAFLSAAKRDAEGRLERLADLATDLEG